MKVDKIIAKIEEQELNITGATLLSMNEAKLLSPRLLRYDNWWWLRSPGYYQLRAAGVDRGGDVSGSGYFVNFDYYTVRPALQIENLKSSNFEIGDCFIFDGKEFEIVSDTLAFCKEDIGRHCFRNDWKAIDAKDYAASDVKKYVDKWFKAAKKM